MTNYNGVIDFLRIARDVDTGAPPTVQILDTEYAIARTLTPDMSRAVARKLTALADECERHKPLRRLVAVGDELRGLDD